jgi:hypothetical protein
MIGDALGQRTFTTPPTITIFQVYCAKIYEILPDERFLTRKFYKEKEDS